jgi:hypothetical protein
MQSHYVQSRVLTLYILILQEEGTAALHYSAFYGDASILKLLVDAGSDVNTKDVTPRRLGRAEVGRSLSNCHCQRPSEIGIELRDLGIIMQRPV